MPAISSARQTAKKAEILQGVVMMSDLKGIRVAILATDGVEQAELTEPRKFMDQLGAETTLLSPKTGQIQALYPGPGYPGSKYNGIGKVISKSYCTKIACQVNPQASHLRNLAHQRATPARKSSL